MEKQCCFCSFQLKNRNSHITVFSLWLPYLLVGNRNWKPLEQSAIGWLVWQDEGDVAGCLLSPFTFKVFCFPTYPNSHYLNIHCRMSAVRALKTLKLGISAQFCCFYYLWGEKEKTRGKFRSYIWPVKEIDAVLLFPSELMERIKLSFLYRAHGCSIVSSSFQSIWACLCLCRKENWNWKGHLSWQSCHRDKRRKEQLGKDAGCAVYVLLALCWLLRRFFFFFLSWNQCPNLWNWEHRQNNILRRMCQLMLSRC